MFDFFDFRAASHESAPEVKMPRRVYASLAESEAGPESIRRQFEAIDADAEDRRSTEDLWNAEAGLPISVLEYRARKTDRNLLAGGTANQVLEIEFDDSGAGLEIYQYFNLFAGPQTRRVSRVSTISRTKAKRVLVTPTAQSFPGASKQEIENALRTFDAHMGVAAAFDVGQGNCNAVMAQSTTGHHWPVGYYDFGGGVHSNTRTYPMALHSMCYTRQPTVVLSHWDWDHWSSAMRSHGAQPVAQALNSKWIVPRQRIGRVHATFLARLNANNNVLFWDPSVPIISTSSVTVGQCTGKTRNDSGLAMLFTPDWAKANGVLFTGDCSYSCLPLSFKRDVDALVVPHHGGVTAGGTPPRAATVDARWVVSYGQGNVDGHPYDASLTPHHAEGWSRARRVDTADRVTHQLGSLGHVLIGPPGSAGVILNMPGCDGQNCQLPLVQ